MELRWYRRRLELKHPWTLARGTSQAKEYWFVELEDGGAIGRGEAAHNARYGESLESVEDSFRRADEHGSLPPDAPAAARAAVDIARCDLGGLQRGFPVCELLGIERRPLPPTSFSIGIDAAETIERKVLEADKFQILKLKLGGAYDEEIVSALRRVSDKPVRVDANEGWTRREHAMRMIDWLHSRNVELVEQPMPAGQLEDVAWLRERSPIPLIADEDALGSGNETDLAAAYDGVNVKLMKAGGIRPALQAIRAARAAGLTVMLGCMIESSLGISAATHLAPLADYLDLDGHLLLADDPFAGLACRDGRLEVPDLPGLGVFER